MRDSTAERVYKRHPRPENGTTGSETWVFDRHHDETIIGELFDHPEKLVYQIAFYESAAENIYVPLLFSRRYADGGYSPRSVVNTSEELAQLQRLYLQRHCQQLATLCRKKRSLFYDLAPQVTELSSVRALDEAVQTIHANTADKAPHCFPETIPDCAELRAMLCESIAWPETDGFDLQTEQDGMLAKFRKLRQDLLRNLILGRETYDCRQRLGERSRKSIPGPGIAPD